MLVRIRRQREAEIPRRTSDEHAFGMWTHPDFEAIAALFTTRTGIPIPSDRMRYVEAGIRRAMSRVQATGIEEFYARVLVDTDALDEVIRELAVGETYFFRDPSQFDFVRHTVLPDIRRRRGARHVVRAWSAGCSTGEEPYSLAILFEDEKLAGCSSILATDVSRPALERARRGVYRPWSLRGEGSDRARKHLHLVGNRYCLDERIKRHVEFRALNLVTDEYPSIASGAWDMDFVFCRNVLIYFPQQTVELVARKVAESIVEGGFLITGPSDPLLSSHAPLEPIVTPQGVFYRRKETPMVAVPAHAPSAENGAGHAAAAASEAAAAAATASASASASATAAATASATAAVAAPAAALAHVHAPPSSEQQALIEAAGEAMAVGDYRRAAELTWDPTLGATICVLHVRALSNVDAARAEAACDGAVTMYPLSTELRYLHATLLLGLGRDADAEQAARRALYLDRSLAVGHALLGTILKRRCDLDGARRSFRNAYRICAAMPADAPIPLAEGELAGTMARAVASELAWLAGSEEAAS